ncbi:unnamed protein product [Nippostrongylus brasiliensis]|uniref:GrBNV_gp95-like protein n=1 Tax=Nippostrongylus brasiliensis TaxID=27835 RepID=A0A0N4Y449_NIPBR|nr:unnamed protein product [Nippostrongylus brasiliensis]
MSTTAATSIVSNDGDPMPTAAKSEATASDDADALSTTSSDSGNGSLNNSSVHDSSTARTPPWPLENEPNDEPQASPSTSFNGESQPLIVSSVDESAEDDVLSSLHFPHLSTTDRLLNLLFVIVLIIMIICAVLSIHFLQLSEQYHSTLR